MLNKTNLSVDLSVLEETNTFDFNQMKTSINQPTGNFFYEPWIIKEEYKNSIWERLLQPLGENIGEARIIVLDNGKCYLRHADIDDRYHLSIKGEYSYLIDLKDQSMYETKVDGYWYEMNAGIPHTAINAGGYNRIQLVVRRLLNENNISQPVFVKLIGSNFDSRYVFDAIYSPWLNKANKLGTISNFSYDEKQVNFIVEKSCLKDLEKMKPDDFEMEIS